MKTTLATLATALAFAMPAYAVDEHHPEGQPSAATTPSPEKTVQQMQDNVAKMQTQLEGIGKAGTPAERRQMMIEHMQTMRENMMLGQQVAMGGMDCPMMGDGMGMMGQGGAGGDPGAMMKRMQQMERRMDMMQKMMERQTSAKPAPRSK